MKHLTARHTKMWPLMLYMMFIMGCAHHQATASEPTIQVPAPIAQESLIHEAREEAELLRAELATIKIAAAKQQADLRAARQQLESLKTREETIATDIQKVRENLLVVEGERDQLRREVTELQARSASVPNIQELMVELRTIQGSVQEMMANMKTLMTEVIHIKQDMERHQQNPQARTANLTAFSMTKPTPSHTAIGSWTVASGDTLWSISQQHQTTVDTLINMNDLTSDFIVKGQILKVPVIASPQQLEEDEMNQVANTLDSSAENTESP